MRALMLVEYLAILLVAIFVLWVVWKQISKLPVIQVWLKKSEMAEISDLAKNVSKPGKPPGYRGICPESDEFEKDQKTVKDFLKKE